MGKYDFPLPCRLEDQEKCLIHHTRVSEKLGRMKKELEVLRPFAALGEEVAGLAHSWKNAVHGLRGYTSLIRSKLVHHGEGLEAVEGLRELIDRLDEFARITLGNLSCSRSERIESNYLTPFEAAHAIDAVMEEVSLDFPKIRWAKLHESEFPGLAFPRALFREVLVNVLRNAAEALNGLGEIMVETGKWQEFFQILVRNHAAGVSRKELKRMFRPAYTTKPQGSGFGLYLARKLIRSHGGNLFARGDPEGGVMFLIHLRMVEGGGK